MNGKSPDNYPRRIVLCISGLSPQIVTETLYALAMKRTPAFLPTEVHLITTAEGANRAELTLLSKEPGWFRRLCADYNLKEPRFDSDQIHVLRAHNGEPMWDLRTAEDNEAAADGIFRVVRSLVEAPDSALHVSIAGGRKTMGFFAGYALSLVGREQDCLSHVLVSSPYESHPDFFYPSPRTHIIYTFPPDSRPLDAALAEITLADIPIVRLRRFLDRQPETSGFRDAVSAARLELETCTLKIEAQRLRIVFAGATCTLSPASMAFLSWFARCRVRGGEALRCPPDGAPEAAYAQGFLDEYRCLSKDGEAPERTRKALQNGMEKNFFLEKRSRLHKELFSALGERALQVSIRAVGRRPNTVYQLAVPASAIEFELPTRNERHERILDH